MEQYTKGLVPEDYTVRTNRLDQTAGELFKKSYASLIQDGSAWFKETSESCSVVAALLAGISFATSSTISGGNNSETGKPTLEGRPAFDAFALSSVIGLCFSVKHFVFLIYAYTCFPVTLYAVAQLPLYTDLLRGIVTKLSKTSDKGEDL